MRLVTQSGLLIGGPLLSTYLYKQPLAIAMYVIFVHSGGEGHSRMSPEHITNEEGPSPSDLPMSEPATGEGGPSLPESPAPDSSKKKHKKRGRGFSFGKDWVKSTFSRKRTSSVI